MTESLTDQYTAEFKRNLQAILDERKLSPKRLSLNAGLGETSVRDILANRSQSPKLDTAHKIATALNIGIYDLIPSMLGTFTQELDDLRAENQALHEALNSTYTSVEDSIKAARERIARMKKK